MDRFKAPDEREQEVACRCGQCDESLFVGLEVFFDHRTDLSFCGRRCFKEYLIENIMQEVDEFIDLLEDVGNVWEKEAR